MASVSGPVDLNTGLGQVVSWYITTVLAVVFLAARFFVKWRKFGIWQADDSFLVLAALCLVGTLVIQQYMWSEGMARPPQSSSFDQFVHIMQMIIPGSTLYVTSIWSVKVALVIFYKRIATGGKLQTVYNCLLGFLATSWLVLFFDIIFQCYPIERKWTGVKDPKCKTATTPTFGRIILACSQHASEINFWMTVLLIIALPISMVIKLKMPQKQKIGVAAMFALGIFVVISSIIRAYFSKAGEIMSTCTVSMIETSIAIVAASLPVFRTLLSGGMKRRTSSLSYNKSYEMSSAARQSNISGGRNMKANDSEDEIFKNDRIEGAPRILRHDSISITKEFHISETILTQAELGQWRKINDF
ncbi:hypothetical protein HYFRA_00012510 [Hymenoscyphus fraxineus]|uniref:Rhodopsin domain-containing protein n=1 Tax=Hymenoscyphus fraxineus TaxID=746836 RepID=A0A9N9L027_9HELO|nr:hypothetical protein HYFRA_00012510 [Hymenoscyphus fraxineus]